MNKEIELLSPAGNFDCLISAVQNGANAVYFGADKFNARAGSTNFSREELKRAIEYAKLRNVKTHLTLNILIKNEEFSEAIQLVQYAYECGIDAIIVQDLGLAKYIIDHFPGLEVHASTQMTTYDINGVKELEKMGFDRVVLSRELSMEEIKNICEQTKLDIEVFIHGALCISYSGQCLMSSMIGQRSGNRGKCAGTCRLPYQLINTKTNETLQKGYLLSSKDVCTLDIIPEMIATGVKSFKIEGRMKTPEYVAIVTSIYRKYIDLALSNKPYIVEEQDREKLLQAFNRGGFSTGYLKGKLGRDMMYTQRPNHMGIKIGKVLGYNENKGHVKLSLEKDLNLGDSIRINDDSCKISELMKNKINIKTARNGEIVTIGRIRGRIRTGDSVYKTVSIKLLDEVKQNLREENAKRNLICNLKLKVGESLEAEFEDVETEIKVKYKGDIVQKAEKTPTPEDRIKEQICKTNNTVFKIDKINIDLSDNAFVQIKELNEARREALQELEEKILNTFKRDNIKIEKEEKLQIENRKIKNVSVLLNFINPEYNYKLLKGAYKIYIPVTEFFNQAKREKIKELTENKNVYVYLPTITKQNFRELIESRIEEILEMNIKGFVVSSLSQLEMVKKYKLEVIANYTMNVFNNNTAEMLENLEFTTITVSPEEGAEEIKNLETGKAKKEIIAYGRTPLMTSEYCPIGTFKNCVGTCQKGKYVLKDRLGFEFPVYTNRINCNSVVYNSKITSIETEGLNVDSIRIDILEESIDEINNIIETQKAGKKMQGKEYTNGNLNKIV